MSPGSSARNVSELAVSIRLAPMLPLRDVFAFDKKKRNQPRRERFLAEVEAVVPRSALLAVIDDGPVWPLSQAAGLGAADPPHAAALRPVGPGDGGCALRDRVHVPLCRAGPVRGYRRVKSYCHEPYNYPPR